MIHLKGNGKYIPLRIFADFVIYFLYVLFQRKVYFEYAIFMRRKCHNNHFEPLQYSFEYNLYRTYICPFYSKILC